MEKMQAGENRAVEHVALEDDAVARLVGRQAKQQPDGLPVTPAATAGKRRRKVE